MRAVLGGLQPGACRQRVNVHGVPSQTARTGLEFRASGLRARGRRSCSVLRASAEGYGGHLTPPLQFMTTKLLTAEEGMPAPVWGTFCGVSNGLWVGTAAAYNPSTGEAEAASLEGRAPVYTQGSCCVETRVQEGGRDWMLRQRKYTNTQESFHHALRQASADGVGWGSSAAGSTDGSWGDGWVEERLESQMEGLAIFEGGSYSLGPTSLGGSFPTGIDSGWEAELEDRVEGGGGEEQEGEEEEGEEEWVEEDREDGEEQVPPHYLGLGDGEAEVEERRTSVSEWCLQWGSGHRVRLVLTLSTAGGVDGCELDVEVLRVMVAAEKWEGLPGTYAPNSVQQQGMSLAGLQGPRLKPDQLRGEWKVFETSCTTVEDVSMETGLPCRLPFYSTRETLQRVEGGGTAPSPQTQGSMSTVGVEEEVDGAVLWLPQQMALQLRMVPPSSYSVMRGGFHGDGVSCSSAWQQQQPSPLQGEVASGMNGSSAAGMNGAGEGRNDGALHTEGQEVGGVPGDELLPGLHLNVLWVPNASTLMSMTRQYCGKGELQGVLCTTAIRA